jgi:hypothetical protein
MGEPSKDVYKEFEKLLKPIKSVEVTHFLQRKLILNLIFLYECRKNGSLSQLFLKPKVL